MSIFHDQAEFLSAGEKHFPTENQQELDLSATLLEEEWKEWLEEDDYAFNGNSNDLKEVLDLIYVAAQYLNVRVGPNVAEELWNALHENNMSKCIDGKLVKRADGKILKPLDYVPFDINEKLKELGCY